MASVADHGEAAVGARGLTGHAYRGHVFWDADLFVLPFLAATEPAAARAMLEYRLNRLPAALAAARSEGRARRPLPVGIGRERLRRDARVPVATRPGGSRRSAPAKPRCTSSATSRGPRAATSTGPAIKHLPPGPAGRSSSRPRATGRRVSASTAPGVAHLYGVIGPDEYHEPVDDNAFTNVLARWNLRRAAGRGSLDRRRRGQRRGARQLAPARRRARRRLRSGDRRLRGVRGLLRSRAVAHRETSRPGVRSRPTSCSGRERVHRSQIVKQADVLMLHHLLPDEVEPGTLAANLDYYEPRTAHGSSLSLGIHAALFARVGRVDEALAALRVTAGIDMDDLARTGAGGVHLAAMGSVWQALAYGFAGLRPGGDALKIDPRLPAEWSELELSRPVPRRPDQAATRVRSDRCDVSGAGRRGCRRTTDRVRSRSDADPELESTRCDMTVLAAIDDSAVAGSVLERCSPDRHAVRHGGREPSRAEGDVAATLRAEAAAAATRSRSSSAPATAWEAGARRPHRARARPVARPARRGRAAPCCRSTAAPSTRRSRGRRREPCPHGSLRASRRSSRSRS